MKKRSLAVMAAALVATSVWAQPVGKPVRIIVTFNAGGPVDTMARTIAEPLGKALDRTVIVENKPGANGAIGAAEVLRSEPDGSVIWITSVGAAAINQSLYPKLTYNMQTDFAPVSLVANNVELFVVNPKETARDASEFVAQIKSRKESPPIASSGKGSIPHLALAQLEMATGVELLHVPYNGMAPALTDLLGGQVAGVFADVPAVMTYVRSGKLKALGIAAPQRHAALPDVKTFQEQGFANVDSNNWYAMFVSARTAPNVVQQLNKAVRAAVADPAANAKIVQSGAEPKSSSPEELAALLKSDTEKWAHLIKTRNIKVE
ncbi:Bug family tripartite tricarboxylate transporter substrate binding protein [Hydrogenophaga sp.]|uniref:Bug family tripartite tricarboxylate transporter substrate binding protein n=1 Tax=Hydrogenophaga sp. TaxID=1904254 RepID=UPI002FCA2587